MNPSLHRDGVSVVSPELAQSIAADWASFMEIPSEKFTLQVGSFDMLTEEAKWASTGDEYGVTIGSPENDRFIIGISDKCPPEKLEHVIIHELVHVYSFSAVGADERENMELLTDQLALMIQRLRQLEEPHDVVSGGS